MEFLVLMILSERSCPDPARFAKVFGLNRRRVARAWSRLGVRGLIVPRADATADASPVFEATEIGRTLIRDALLALEVSDFEPESLQHLRTRELKAPLPSAHRLGGL